MQLRRSIRVPHLSCLTADAALLVSSIPDACAAGEQCSAGALRPRQSSFPPAVSRSTDDQQSDRAHDRPHQHRWPPRSPAASSNAFGTNALQIGGAHIALHDKDSAIVAGSDHTLTFSGRATVVIPSGRRNAQRPARFRSSRTRRPGDQPLRSSRSYGSDHPPHRFAHHLHLAAR